MSCKQQKGHWAKDAARFQAWLFLQVPKFDAEKYMETNELFRNWQKWDYFSIHDIDEVVLPYKNYKITTFLSYVEKKSRQFSQFYISQFLFVDENQPKSVLEAKINRRTKKGRHKRELNETLKFLSKFNRYTKAVPNWKRIFRWLSYIDIKFRSVALETLSLRMNFPHLSREEL